MSKLAGYERKRRALSVLFPNRCPFCGQVVGARDYWCGGCPELLPYISREPIKPDGISRYIACCWYSGLVKKAIYMLKYGCVTYPAEAFALMLSERIKQAGLSPDCLVPVPSGIVTVERRGFSPAEEIARGISLRLEIPVITAVRANIGKLEQKTLSRRRRAENARRSFYIDDRADVAGKSVLLIDDVTTTGSSLAAAAELLLKSGAAEVSAAVFAKVPEYLGRPNLRKRYRLRKPRSDP